MKGKGGGFSLSPCENLKHCCVSKPPLVLFTVGLCLLAVVFVSLALYVKDNTDISDPNFNTDWGTFQKDLTSFNWMSPSDCVKTNTDSLPKLPSNVTEQISVEVLINPEKKFSLAKDESYRAVVWKKEMLPKENIKKKQTAVVISFSHIRATNSSGGDVSVDDGSQVALCMTISAKDTFLSNRLIAPKSCVPAVITPSDAQKILPIYPCSQTEEGVLFQTLYEQTISLKMYLTPVDRANIHIHLMSTSYFLFVVAVTVLLYGIIRRKAHIVSDV